MKLFYLINEPFEGYQSGYRKAINELVQKKILSDVYFYSFLSKLQEMGSWSRVLIDLKKNITEFKPELILVAHLNKHTIITSDYISEINSSFDSEPVWIYDERDVYGYFSKPLSRNVLNFAANCDLVTLVTYGKMMNRFKKAGAKNIIYLPHVYDANFGTDWQPTKTRKYDIIMIANRSKSRIPLRSMPGIKEREKIVMLFSKTFGDRFAIYGRGWDGFPCSHGPINFFDQEKLLQKSTLSIGMDHFFRYDGYFSDRLPIALVSGLPHLTYRTPGLDKLFVDKKHLFFFETPTEALKIAIQLLNKTQTELDEIGKSSRSYVREHFTEVSRYQKITDLGIAIYYSKNKECS